MNAGRGVEDRPLPVGFGLALISGIEELVEVVLRIQRAVTHEREDPGAVPHWAIEGARRTI